ncbi:cucumber peeling cupredoxin-like [Benincasa hispida]|uniref:cucumber peeling cupredoxin-like n=1 Tax=Benincasa hispida TaxID=102211 RepID=UPI00190225D1|nr:cucumber peeling cupredoxin-like [Benincasa hispida]
MGGGVGLVLGLIAVVFVHHPTAQTVRVVGDSTGWTVPQGGAAFYSDWASKNYFTIGDYLTFNFESNMHNVLKVPKESFDACNTYNAIGSLVTTGPTTVKLDTVGVHYFICTIDSHCVQGQKLSVTVTVSTSTPGGAMPPSSNIAQPPPHIDACARTPAILSFSSPLNCDGSSVALTASSTVLMAIHYVTLSAIVISLLF